ncbi:elongation factor P [Patescibacteria group bacterium]
MSAITTSDFRKGIFIEFKKEPYQIMEFQHVNPGKGSAFIRTRLKNLKSGRVQEHTYKSGESVQKLPIITSEMQYLYKEGSEYVFMDNSSFEQYSISSGFIGNFDKYMKPNDTYQIMVWEEKPVGVRLPKKVRLTVSQADDGAKGNTATGATKTVVLETGATVTVPLFIKIGDTIAIDPETNSYLERA